MPLRDLTWSEWGPPDILQPGDIEILKINSELAPTTRTTNELAAQIKTVGGKLIVNANSSNLIVAINNQLRFSVKRNAQGLYEITDRLAGSNLITIALFGGLALLAVVLVSQK